MSGAASALDLFTAAVRGGGSTPAYWYLGREIGYAEIDALSDRLAGFWHELGVTAGDRVAVQLQNVPQFPVAVLAAWKLGAAVVPLNPMYLVEEVTRAVLDSGAKVLVGASSSWAGVVQPVAAAVPGLEVLLTDESAMQSWSHVASVPVPPDQADLMAAASTHAPVAGSASLAGTDVAFLCYTSGTSGLPKAAVITHANLLAAVNGVARWTDLGPSPRIFGLAPLCHISGLVVQFVFALQAHATLVLVHRFAPAVVLAAIRDTRPDFMSGTATAYTALLSEDRFGPDDFSSFQLIGSGGAALPEAVLRRFESRSGRYVHNGYGLTETTAACVTVDKGAVAPTDPDSGVVSVGKPFFNCDVRIVDESGLEVPEGTTGEIVISGPAVVSEYWKHPEETAITMGGGALRTGDLGKVDDGWVYVLDRSKEMINASGYKVSPREVEDVLYRHPSVHEVGVFALPDEYRGETVAACVVLREGAVFDEAEMIGFVRRHLAAYKAPRHVYQVDDLPKNTGGKILRRSLASLLP